MHRELFEQVRQSYTTLCEARQPGRIVHVVSEAVGLTDKDGRRFVDPGTRNFRLADKPRYSATDINPGRLAEAIIGPDWRHHLRLDNDSRTVQVPAVLREEAISPIGPSVWGNVAAWTATVGGLMQAAFLEGYEQAEYDLVGLFPNKQPIFWQGGERFINILGPAEPAPEVAVGEEYPDMAMSALWVEPGPMRKYGGKITLARETAAIDISGGQILQKAKEGGGTLKFRENELILDLITGATNNWKMGFRDDASATGYNTYGATITRPDGSTYTVPNDLTNPLNDLGAFQASDEAVAKLYHPLTGLPVNLNMNLALFPTSMAAWADAINRANGMTPMTQTTVGQAQAAPGTFPNMQIMADNPWKGMVTARASRWLDYRHRLSATQTNPNRSAGLGLTGANVYRWYRLDPAQFACRRAFWEATVIDLNPGDYQMAVQSIIAGQVFNIAVQYQVMNPLACQRNKVS